MAGEPKLPHSFGATRMLDDQTQQSERKRWQPPVLEQLTVDLSAIRQKLAAKVDSGGVGAIS